MFTSINARCFTGAAAMAGCVVLCASLAHAGGTATVLHPPGAVDSIARGVNGSLQGGAIRPPNLSFSRPAIWSGTPGSAVYLSSDLGEVNGVGPGMQVGYTLTPVFEARAMLWRGSQASGVSLHPAISTGSAARATDGVSQVGGASIGGLSHAALWSGSAASWKDLHPAGATHSIAYALSGNQQGGAARVGGADHASLWTSTAASWVDLHPAGASSSQVNGIAGTRQSGAATIGGVVHASMWNGTPESWTSLMPPGANWSEISASVEGAQVGSARFGAIYHAGFWFGTSDSWVDLHSLLPATYLQSIARGAWLDGNTLHVVGVASATSTFSNQQAVMWTVNIPTPSGAALFVFSGALGAVRRRRG